MNAPDLYSSFDYHGHVDVEWYDVHSKADIPEYPWQQVYIIGNYLGKVPVVLYPNGNNNLPGGTTEPDETLDDTLVREIEEELNMRVLSWEPLGYQKCTRAETGEVYYQFRAYAALQKIGDFVRDPGGSIIGHTLVDLDQVNERIGYGVVGDRIITHAKTYFKENK